LGIYSGVAWQQYDADYRNDMVLLKQQRERLQQLPRDVLLSLLFVFIGAGLGRGLSYLRSIIFARVVPPEQLGLFSLAFGAVNLILPFVLGGSTSLLVRYVSYEGKLTKRLLWMALRRPLIVLSILSVFFVIWSATASTIIFGASEFRVLTMLTAVILIAFTLFRLIIAALQGSERFDASVSIDFTNSLVSLLLGASLAFFINAKAEWLLAGTLIGFGAALMLALLIAPRVIRKASQPSDIDQQHSLPEGEAKRFNIWMTYAAIAYVFVNWGLLNRWLLGRQVSYEDAGRMYAVLTLVWLPFLLFQLPGTVLQPRLAAMFHRGEKDAVRQLTNKVMKWGVLSCLLLCGVIGTSVYLWLPQLLGADYMVSYQVILFLTLSCYYHVILYLNSLLAVAEGRADAVFWGNIASASINLCLVLLLVSKLGILGVTFALTVGFFCGALVISLLNKQNQFRYFQSYWLMFFIPSILIVLIAVK
jgi:O-antigen/teichoic acid export membrane protein